MTRKEIDAIQELFDPVVMGPHPDGILFVWDDRLNAFPENQRWHLGTHEGKVWKKKWAGLYGLKVPFKKHGTSDWRWKDCETGEDLGPCDLPSEKLKELGWEKQ